MARKFALYGLIAATLSVSGAYASAFLPGGATKVSAFLMALGIAMMAVSLMILGAVREGESLGGLKWAFAFVFVVFVAGFTAALILPDVDTAASNLFLGLPRRAAIIIYGIGFLPVLVLPFVYARYFEQRTLRPEDLATIKKLAVEYAAKEADKNPAGKAKHS